MPRGVSDRYRGEFPHFLHLYFHDADLLRQRHRVALATLLRFLGRVAEPTDLNSVAATAVATAPEVPWANVFQDDTTQHRGQAEA
jgi:hypothetical protein